MPRLTKITTRGGDKGETSLGSGSRVPKDSLRVAAYGVLDELNSHLGLATAFGPAAPLGEILKRIQNELFNLGAELSVPAGERGRRPGPQVSEGNISQLESDQSALAHRIGPLENFVLPGGTTAAAHLHVARTVCRRAERCIVTLVREETVRPEVLQYLNRLSDVLFVMALYENKVKGRAEAFWNSRL